MSENIQDHLEKRGLYSGNVILEIEPDAKGVKPKIKVNNLATQSEMNQALSNFDFLLEQCHMKILNQGLPITYLQPKEEKVKKDATEKKTQ